MTSFITSTPSIVHLRSSNGTKSEFASAASRAYFKGFQVVEHFFSFFCIDKNANRENCKGRRHKAAIAVGKKPLTTKGSGGAFQTPPPSSQPHTPKTKQP